MYQMCHIPRQNFIESDRIKKVCVCERGGGGDNATELSIIMHFLCVRSRTRLKNVSEIWNLDFESKSRSRTRSSRYWDLDSI